MSSGKISLATLTSLEGKSIEEICDNGYTNPSTNHCAHFVCHVLGYDFGFTCNHMTGKDKTSASIKVHEVFSKCGETGIWRGLDKKKINQCLAFITYSSSVKGKVMLNRPKKHVGIYLNGSVWHYSNSKNKVVKQTVEEFSRHYTGDSFSMFFGTFPK